MAPPFPSTVVDGRSQVGVGAAPGFHLVVMGPAVFHTIPLPARGEIVVGRGSSADIDIDEPRASRRHARLRLGDAITIEDLGSVNGTRVRGRKLEQGKPVAISPGEAVSIGALVLMVQLDRAPAGASSGSSSGASRAGRSVAGFASRVGAVCEDEAMRGVYGLAARAAAGTIGVLLLGETGVGKEVLARAIHDGSPRAARPFVSLNCAALSEALLESELFGHERGAFTGATGAKPGLLETAPGGTVFLDEVGELTPALQAKLLRVIEARELVRVGGLQPRKIDVRFLAATNRDIETDVARGAFRRDLYFRLNGMTLVIPPLRERPLDLPLLARHFVDMLARAAGRRRPPALSEGALAVLAGHDWPGNVRELRNVLERALLLCDGSVITETHLPREARGPRAGTPAAAPAAREEPSERARILDALAACAGNQSRAAKKLGISRKVMLARLDKYGVARPRKPVARKPVDSMSAESGSGSRRTPVTVPEVDSDAGVAAGGPRPGAESERYVLEREIGEGGMGRVFAARDLRLQRPVAIKMLKARDGRIDMRYAARFEREVKLAARLQHPGVVPVYDAGFWPSGEPYLVMKLVLGQSLARVIRDAETPADRLALLPHVITVAEAVAFAHDQGVVHRDLKPINILVGAFGETIVLDWGLAKDLRAGGADGDGGEAPSPSLPSWPAATPAGDTAAGAVLGTPSYMAPEQAAGRAVDARADVYALGAILYHLLAGTVPHSPSLPNAPGGAARPAAVPLAELEAWLPSDLRAIVEKAMATDAQARYPTAFELAEDLRRFQAGQLVAARRYSRGARVGRFVVRNRVVVTVGVIAAGLMALFLGR